MQRIREWSFPVVLLTAWVAIAGYTVSSLGQAQARVAAPPKPAAVAPAFEEVIEVTAPVIAKRVPHERKSQKPVVRHDPRS